MSRRNRSSRRRMYGKRQHEVRERRPTDAPNDDGLVREDVWTTPDAFEDGRGHDADLETWEGYVR